MDRKDFETKSNNEREAEREREGVNRIFFQFISVQFNLFSSIPTLKTIYNRSIKTCNPDKHIEITYEVIMKLN